MSPVRSNIDTMEGTVRQAHYLGKAAKRRVKNDFEIAYEKSMNILDNWDSMKILDAMWTAQVKSPEKPASVRFRPYLIASTWSCILCFFILFYYADIPNFTESSTIIFVLIRSSEIICVFLAVLSLVCCFEQGLNLVLGTVFMASLFWSAPPRKRQ